MMEPSINSLTSLREHFGFSDFREGQREVIDTVLSGKDAVVVMPTGSGKSLCYQLPAMMLNGATLVVSPLIALMKDQVEALQGRRLPATFINSSLHPGEQLARIAALKRGEFKLVYVAPERFRSPRFLTALQSVKISLFAVDEAHCISTWGHDFRPDYLRLKDAIQSLGQVQAIALTATATPYVRRDIIQQLGLRQPQTFVSGFDRPNLSIKVAHTEKLANKLHQIVHLAKRTDGSGIIYASTRKAVEELGVELRQHGLTASLYHAGMSDAIRAKAQDDFMSNRVQMIVATNAFGMGIDKPDIRFVVHYQMPGSIEAYYQEIGRGGRDGLPSTCLLLFNYVDKNTHDFFIDGSYPDISVVQDVYDALFSAGTRHIELSTSELAARAGVRNELAVQSSIYLLERAGHIQRLVTGRNFRDERSKRKARPILLLDASPTKLRVNARELSARGDFERRKLREMIEFCYASTCYRAYILDYFGDRHHQRQCGTCGNCRPYTTPAKVVTTANSGYIADRCTPRRLTDAELLRVRKLLACAKRMKGRFGKQMLAATVRGSAAKNVIQAGLNQLSTYGLLKDMKHDEIGLYIECLIQAECLRTSNGPYPTINITDAGERVMREQQQIELALP
jgi:ATP-dependent DNA helicase RecQ